LSIFNSWGARMHGLVMVSVAAADEPSPDGAAPLGEHPRPQHEQSGARGAERALGITHGVRKCHLPSVWWAGLPGDGHPCIGVQRVLRHDVVTGALLEVEHDGGTRAPLPVELDLLGLDATPELRDDLDDYGEAEVG